MTYATRAAVLASLREFIPVVREQHHVVQLANGRWCRTFGPPDENYTHVRGREWRVR